MLRVYWQGTKRDCLSLRVLNDHTVNVQCSLPTIQGKFTLLTRIEMCTGLFPTFKPGPSHSTFCSCFLLTWGLALSFAVPLQKLKNKVVVKNNTKSEAWDHIPLNPTIRRQRQDSQFKAKLCSIISSKPSLLKEMISSGPCQWTRKVKNPRKLYVKTYLNSPLHKNVNDFFW